MNADNKKILQETSRWLRVGFLTISVLGPAINTLSSRLRERSLMLRKEATKPGSAAYEQSQGRVLTAGTVLSDALNNLKDHSYSQELLKRGSQATHATIERGSDVLQELAERSEKASQELARRGEQVSKEITKRGTQVSKEVTKRSRKAAKEVLKHSQQAQYQLAQRTAQLRQQDTQQNRNSPLWTILGFSMGLTAAGFTAYLLIKKRFEQNKHDTQQLHITQNGHLNGTSKNTTNREIRSVSQPSLAPKTTEVTTPDIATPSLAVIEPLIAEPEIAENETVTEKLQAPTPQESNNIAPTIEEAPSAGVENPVVEQLARADALAASDVHTDATSQTHPAVPVTNTTDATFLGIVSTKQYYPVETPLNTLRSSTDGPLDVIYFASEGEAQAQGYTIAEL